MDLIEKIEYLLTQQKRVIIAIDGPCASGKSTFAEKLAKAFNGVVFKMDDYFLPPHMKTKERLNEIGGNVHYERIYDEILSHLNESQVTYSAFNCQTNEYEENTTIELPSVVIVEGSYSLHSTLRGSYDIKVLLQVSSELQIERLRNRNKKMLQRFINEWIPLENRYFNNELLGEIADYSIDTRLLDL